MLKIEKGNAVKEQTKEQPKNVNCKHSGYRMVDGKLVCAECGELSKSDRWHRNVYGK